MDALDGRIGGRIRLMSPLAVPGQYPVPGTWYVPEHLFGKSERLFGVFEHLFVFGEHCSV